MLISKTKRNLFFIVGIVFILLVVTLSVIWIQREIRWKETRSEMDLFEHEILQKIAITDNERLPAEMIEALYTSIMADDSEVDDQHNPAFEALTEEFLQSINSQMSISLKPEDLEELGYPSKSDIEKYGDEIEIAYYKFVIGEDTFQYIYYRNNRMSKVIDRGLPRVNIVVIINENNERLTAVYSEWRSKAGAYFGKKISIYDYYRYKRNWDNGAYPEDKFITIDNIFRKFYK